MNYSFEIYDKVYDELEAAALWYNQKKVGLGMELFNDWEHTLENLKLNPKGYEKKYKDFRQIKLARFPFLIIYEISNLKIQIIKFIHLKKHPLKRFKKNIK